MNNFKVELEERLVNFAASVLNVADEFPETLKRSDLGIQILYGASAPALIYADAQAADSPKEFLRLLKSSLCNLRHMHISLRIAKQLKGFHTDQIDPVIEECDSLIGLFAKSVKTKKTNIANGAKAKLETA